MKKENTPLGYFPTICRTEVETRDNLKSLAQGNENGMSWKKQDEEGKHTFGLFSNNL